MTDKLKSCPFCGGEGQTGRTAQIWEGKQGFPKFGASCSNKDCLGYQTYCRYETKAEAIKIWNTRK